jgi:hypothetical protein
MPKRYLSESTRAYLANLERRRRTDGAEECDIAEGYADPPARRRRMQDPVVSFNRVMREIGLREV